MTPAALKQALEQKPMTPAQRNRQYVTDAMRYMREQDLAACSEDASLPAWARKMYEEEIDRRYEDAQERLFQRTRPISNATEF